MLTLRLTQERLDEDRYRARLRLEGDGAPLEAAAEFRFQMTAQDEEDLRWYLEEFLQYPVDPAPQIAARVERHMDEVGADLFRAVFQANDDARDLWAVLRRDLPQARVEIITSVTEAATIPWELLRDPKTDAALALRARAFVRTHTQTAQRPRIPQAAADEAIRILLVICRPGGGDDVPFRSVASRLVKGLSQEAQQQYQLDVLRPPTFAQLSRTLRAAHDAGRPYHVVHFDGHGVYADAAEPGGLGRLLQNLSPLLLSGRRAGKHGYLLFENPGREENMQLVDGPALGKLLAETGAAALVLNACRSAHAEPRQQPETADAAAGDVHGEVRALGSLAHEVIDAGVAGVVAMRYNVYVVTAAQFVADLYGALVRGRPLGQAVTLGRKQLAAQPEREIALLAKNKSLAWVLDKFGAVFGPMLEQSGVHWLALDDDARRDVALQVMAQVPLLWIWDNVEPVAGFPGGTESAWTEDEQQELAAFLRAARGTQAKFLLTSRRDERGWLGDLPARVAVPPMPFQERVQLARALAAKQNRRLAEVEDWRPLLRFTQGNPLAITVLVGQALRDGLTTKEEIEAFVAALRRGEAEIDDEESQGRAKSLAASLGYGFQHAFNEEERQQLALLHFFQGFVDVEVLLAMGHPDAEWSLTVLHSLMQEEATGLLDRAAEIGLLVALGGDFYRIHPVLPWYFKQLYDEYYDLPPPANAADGRIPHSPTRAFVEAMGELGNYYANQYMAGNRDVTGVLRMEEANLLSARWLAWRYEWWNALIGTMQGLRVLYGHTSRRAEWKWLVEEIAPAFVDAETGGPLPDREEQWGLIIQYRVHLALEAREWKEAERLQRVAMTWARKRAALVLDGGSEDLDFASRNAIYMVAVLLEEWGHILREQGEVACLEQYEEAIELYQIIGNRSGEAISAFNLGRAYTEVTIVRDLVEAERWYRRSLDLRAEEDRLGRARCVGQLGLVTWERFKERRETGASAEELRAYLKDALHSYQRTLELLPADAIDDLAVGHGQIGLIYDNDGNVDHALSHYREAVRYAEAAGNFYRAGSNCFNIAMALAQRGRFPDARVYAQAAMQNYRRYGDRAAADIQRTQQLLADIEHDMG